MMVITLETRSGDFLTHVQISPFLVAPDIVVWRSHFFKLYTASTVVGVPFVYREAIAVTSFTTLEESTTLSPKT